MTRPFHIYISLLLFLLLFATPAIADIDCKQLKINFNYSSERLVMVEADLKACSKNPTDCDLRNMFGDHLRLILKTTKMGLNLSKSCDLCTTLDSDRAILVTKNLEVKEEYATCLRGDHQGAPDCHILDRVAQSAEFYIEVNDYNYRRFCNEE